MKQTQHTNLGDSIFTIEKPDTTWHSTMVGVVVMVAIGFIILLVSSLLG